MVGDGSEPNRFPIQYRPQTQHQGAQHKGEQSRHWYRITTPLASAENHHQRYIEGHDAHHADGDEQSEVYVAD